jgi:hypothetical protein
VWFAETVVDWLFVAALLVWLLILSGRIPL